MAQSFDYDSDDEIETDKNFPGDKLQNAVERMIERAGSVLDTEQKAKLRNLVYDSSMSGDWLSLEMDQLK